MRRKFTCYRCGKYVEAEMDDDGVATCPACENVIDLEPERKLQNCIASLESQLTEARARLAGYEVGFDPKVKLPKDRQTVIAKEVRDDQPIYWDVEFLNGDDGNLWVNWAFAEPSNTADIVRWFPLPGAKEEK